MTSTDNPALRVQGPGDMVAAIPFLLGFHPTESLVLVGLDGSSVIVTARVDLADLADVLGDTLAAIRRGGAATVVAAIFSRTTTTMPIADRLNDLATHVGIEVVDTMLVSDGRWWSLGCTNPQCCPPEGTPLPGTPTAFQAAATYAGLTVLPSRDDLTAMFTPLPDREQLADHLEKHTHEQLSAVLTGKHDGYDRRAIRTLFAAERAAQDGQLPADDFVARFGVALQSYPVRDAIWLAVDEGRLDGIELWVNLARRLPSPYDAAALFLAGWSSYREGNGALAGIAAELALKSDPGCTAADLLLDVLSRGIDPRALPKLRAQSRGSDQPTTA